MNEETKTAIGKHGWILGQGAPNAEIKGLILGCQAWSFRLFNFEQALAKNAALGLRVIEAYPGQPLASAIPGAMFDHHMSEEAMSETRTMLAAAGVRIINYGVVGLPNDEAECRRVFKFAADMGISTIVSEPPLAVLPLLDKLTQQYGINVAIHNHPMPSPYWNPEIVLEAVSGLNPRIGACADTGHWLRSKVSPMAAIKMLEGRIISFHFKDLNEWGMEGHDVPWGTGIASVKELLAEIWRQGFEGVFSIEYEHNWDDSLPEIAECVANFDRFAAELIA